MPLNHAGVQRSSRPEVFCEKGVLRNFANFTGKHLCQSLFFNKVAGPGPATLLKKRLQHRCFPVNFAKFLRHLFLQSTSSGCFYVYSFFSIFTIFQTNHQINFDLLIRELKGLVMKIRHQMLLQKQSSRGVLYKRHSQKFRKIHRKILRNF